LAGLILSLAIGLLYFRDLGDVTQMLLKIKRKDVHFFIRNEQRLLATGLGAVVVATIAHFALGGGPFWVWLTALLLCALLYGFRYIWVRFFRARTQADFHDNFKPEPRLG
jgi:hypothetical protein